jgi:ribonuclease P protein component
MLPKELRLKRKSDIEKLFIKGESAKDSLLICKFRKNNLNHHRPCFTVAKKIKLNAVERNRIRRKTSHAFTDYLKKKLTPENSGLDIIFIVCNLPNDQTSSFQQLQKNINNIMTKITNA